jgi:hypothetical protein
MSFESYEATGYAQFGFANHLALIVCFISYTNWVWGEKYPNNTRLP